MNPYLVKLRDVRRKRIDWNNGEGKGKLDPYLKEEMYTLRKLQEWEHNRPFVIRLTENPWIKEIEVNVSRDLNLILQPRVKLVFFIISLEPHGAQFDPAHHLTYLRDIFASPAYTVKPVFVDEIDISSRMFDNNDDFRSFVYCDKKKMHKRKAVHFGNLTVFFRNLSFISPPPENENTNNDVYLKIKAGRQFLRAQKFAHFTLRHLGDDFVLKAKVPVYEDPDLLLAHFSAAHPGYMEHSRPLIMLHNLVYKWFVQPNSSEPTEELLASFLSFFGPIRYLDVSKDKVNEELCIVSVEYSLHDDFLNALKTLCCCSLRQEHSPEFVDYEVSLGIVSSRLKLALQSLKPGEKMLSVGQCM